MQPPNALGNNQEHIAGSDEELEFKLKCYSELLPQI
jgi:hypothetical protein